MGGVFNIPEHVGKVYREQGVKVEISYEGEWLTGSTIELMEVRVDELIGGAQGLGTLWGQKTHPIGSKEMAKKKQVLYGIVLSFLIDFSWKEKKHPCHMSNSYPFLIWRNLYLVSISQMHRWVFCRHQDTPSRLKVLVGSPTIWIECHQVANL